MTGVQTCALPISNHRHQRATGGGSTRELLTGVRSHKPFEVGRAARDHPDAVLPEEGRTRRPLIVRTRREEEAVRRTDRRPIALKRLKLEIGQVVVVGTAIYWTVARVEIGRASCRERVLVTV